MQEMRKLPPLRKVVGYESALNILDKNVIRKIVYQRTQYVPLIRQRLLRSLAFGDVAEHDSAAYEDCILVEPWG